MTDKLSDKLLSAAKTLVMGWRSYISIETGNGYDRGVNDKLDDDWYVGVSELKKFFEDTLSNIGYKIENWQVKTPRSKHGPDEIRAHTIEFRIANKEHQMKIFGGGAYFLINKKNASEDKECISYCQISLHDGSSRGGTDTFDIEAATDEIVKFIKDHGAKKVKVSSTQS